MHRSDLATGAMLAVGAGRVFDNLVLHWLLSWHRIAPYDWTLALEIASFALGLALLAWGSARIHGRTSA